MKPIKNIDSFGRRLRDSRQEKGISQEELAKRLSTSPKLISRYERGETKPSIVAALGLAKALDTTVGYLLGETNQHDRELADILRDYNDVPPSGQEEIKVMLSTLIKVKLKPTSTH